MNKTELITIKVQSDNGSKHLFPTESDSNFIVVSNEGSALVDEIITQTAMRALHWLMSSSLRQQRERCICLCAHHSGGNEGGAFVYVCITQAATRAVHLFMCSSLRRQRGWCICLCAHHSGGNDGGAFVYVLNTETRKKLEF